MPHGVRMATKQPQQQHFFIQRGESEGIGQIPTDVLHAKSYMELAADTNYTQWKKHRRMNAPVIEIVNVVAVIGQIVEMRTDI